MGLLKDDGGSPHWWLIEGGGALSWRDMSSLVVRRSPKHIFLCSWLYSSAMGVVGFEGGLPIMRFDVQYVDGVSWGCGEWIKLLTKSKCTPSEAWKEVVHSSIKSLYQWHYSSLEDRGRLWETPWWNGSIYSMQSECGIFFLYFKTNVFRGEKAHLWEAARKLWWDGQGLRLGF